MLTGQESIKELLAKNEGVEAILDKFGMSAAVIKKAKYKNLAQAAIGLKKPLAKILDALSLELDEEVKKPSVKGLDHQQRSGGLKVKKIENIKNVIAVHSGKGGVGKTFVAVNLAAHLAKAGHKVGLLDADIDCPNIMKMLKMKGKLVANCHNKIDPLQKFDLKIVSIAPMLPSEDDAVMWRGPVISRAMEQLIHDTDWGELDYLIIDLPPGTSDIPLSVLHMLEDCKILVVTTPQELSVLDAKRSIKMAKNMGRKVVGIIENMAGDVFGRIDEGVLETGIIESIEMKPEFALMAQDGKPVVLSDAKLEERFKNIAQKL